MVIENHYTFISADDEDVSCIRKPQTAPVLKPFPLQDPSKFKFKRQISTESTDSSDIKFSNKSPVKRLQKDASGKQDTVVSAFPKSLPQLSGDEPVKCKPKPYESTVEWIIKNDGPNSEQDFFHISHAKKQLNELTDMQTELESGTTSRRESDNSMNMHKRIMTDFYTRGCDAVGTGTTQSSKNHLGENEKGFPFPEKAIVTEPIPFSPRIVSSAARPKFPMTDATVQTSQGRRTKDRYGSLDSAGCDKSSSNEITSMSQDSCFRERQILTEFYRKRALRSNSDIPRSPSKQEIEELRKIINYHRSLSDPTYISPQKKAMLFEERMVEDLHDDVFEEQTTSTPVRSDGRSTVSRSGTANYTNIDMQFIHEFVEQEVKKKLAKRQLFEKHMEPWKMYDGKSSSVLVYQPLINTAISMLNKTNQKAKCWSCKVWVLVFCFDFTLYKRRL